MENIPAGHYVCRPDPQTDRVCGYDPISVENMGKVVPVKIAIGIAAENLREGFRVRVDQDGKVREDVA